MARSILTWRTVWYLGYGLLLLPVLLYIRFPAEAFKDYCEKRLERLFPERVWHIGKIGYQFPAILTFYALKVSGNVDARPGEIVIDQLMVEVGRDQWNPVLKVHGTSYGGNFSALVVYDYQQEIVTMNNFQLDGFNLAAFTKSYANIPRKVAGTVHIAGNCQFGLDNPRGGTGRGKIVVRSGSVDVLEPILSLAAIDFQHLAMTVNFAGERLVVAEGRLQGNDLTAEFSGEIMGFPAFSASEVRLGGSLVLSSAYAAKNPEEQKLVQGLMKRYNMTSLPFKIGGNLNRPTFRLSP